MCNNNDNINASQSCADSYGKLFVLDSPQHLSKEGRTVQVIDELNIYCVGSLYLFDVERLLSKQRRMLQVSNLLHLFFSLFYTSYISSILRVHSLMCMNPCLLLSPAPLSPLIWMALTA